MTVVAGAAQAAELRGLIAFSGQNVKWGAPAYGTGAEITYAFLDRPRAFPGARNCADMLPLRSLTNRSLVPMADFRAAVQEATAAWSRAAPLSFREVDDAEAADILIGAQRGYRGVAFTNVNRDDGRGPLASLTRASICLDPSERWSAAWDGDPATYDLPRVVAHEIGHAVGLDHLGRDGGIMGYAYLEQHELRLSAADVAAVTRLYGWAAGPAEAAAHDTAPAGVAGACAALDGATVECALTAPGGTVTRRF
jgi:hypothetical protein